MRFVEWLKLTDENETDESVAMIAADARTGIMPDFASREDAEKWFQSSGCNDEVMEAMRVAWAAYADDVGEVTQQSTTDPMGLPFMPGARTTLADARLQLVCAALNGLLSDKIDGWNNGADGGRLSAVTAVEIADSALKAMRG